MHTRPMKAGFALATLAMLAAATVASASAEADDPDEGAVSPNCTVSQATSTTGGGMFTPDINAAGTLVAFGSSDSVTGPNLGNNSEVFLHTVGGGNVQLTETPTPGIGAFGASIDADGDHIAFITNRTDGVSNPDGNYETYVRTVGGPTAQITDQTVWPVNQGYSPALSADGFRVVYTIGQVLREQSDGVGTATLVAPTGGNGDPVIDADGTRIAWASSADLAAGENLDHNVEVFLWDAQANPAISQLTHTSATDDVPGVSISADGNRVAFTSRADINGGNPDLGREVWVYDVAAGTTTQVSDIVTGGNSTFSPTISGDGTKVAFVSSRDVVGQNPDAGFEVFLHDLVTESTIQVTNTALTGFNDRPSLDHDGNRLAFLSSDNLAGGNADGSTELFVATCSSSPPPAARPDGHIRLGTTEAFRGNDVYNTTGANQTRAGRGARGTTVRYTIRAQNDRSVADDLTLRGAAGNTGSYQVTYFAGATNITARVVAGTYTMANLAPGASRTIQMRVAVKQAAPRSLNVTRLVTIRSVASPAVRDVVKAVTTRR